MDAYWTSVTKGARQFPKVSFSSVPDSDICFVPVKFVFSGRQLQMKFKIESTKKPNNLRFLKRKKSNETLPIQYSGTKKIM